MTLYLSQKALFCLFLGGCLIGMAAALIYSLTELCLLREPRSSFGRVFRHIVASLRDFLLFSAVGVSDAILFFVYYSGRVRATVFVLNLVGFGIFYYFVTKPITLWLKRLGKRLFKRGEDVL